MLVSTKLTLCCAVEQFWSGFWKLRGSVKILLGWCCVQWRCDMDTRIQHSLRLRLQKCVLFDILHPFAMQGMRGGMEEVIQCIRGFYKCHLMTKTSVHVWMHRIGRQNWKDTATLKLLFGLYVLAFSAGVIGGNTKCSKYFLTRCILIFFGETNWDLCIP